jgi:hypothetical protein
MNMAHDCRRCAFARHETAMNSASNLLNRDPRMTACDGAADDGRALARC